MSLYKMFTKLVDEKNNRIFCCVRVPDLEPKKFDFFLMKKAIHIMIKKKSKTNILPFILYSI